MPTTGMTRAFGGIVSDRSIDVRVRRALDRFGQPFLWVTNQGVYLDDVGRVALRLNGTTLSQTVDGLRLNPSGSPVIAGLTITGFNGFLYSTSGVVSAATNLCSLLTSSGVQAGNTAATETTLFTYTVPANTLASDGDCLEFMVSGSMSSAADTNKRVLAQFGATTILDTTSLTLGGFGFDWTMRGTIIRTGAATQKCECSFEYNYSLGETIGTTLNYITAAETLSGTVVLRIRGNATTANAVLGEFWKVVKQST